MTLSARIGVFLRVRGMEMIGKKVYCLAAVFALLFTVAVPVAAEEKTIDLNIPGCSA